MSTSHNSDWLEKVYAAKDSQELETVYDDWADQYDEDLSRYGYRLPSVVIGLIGRYVRELDGAILGAGAGTGLLGEVMALMGYHELVAVDLSPGMLKAASEKKVYSGLFPMILGEHIDFSDNAFAAVVSSGTFTVGHAPPESFVELIRITKPGGHIIFSVRCDGENGEPYRKMQEALEKAGKWQLLEMTEPFQSLPLKEPEVSNKVFAYRVS